jgi:hypothetical protein
MTSTDDSHCITDRVRTHNAPIYLNLLTGVDAFADHWRFREKVDFSGECWEWRGARNSRGYGCLGYQKQPWLAHRFAYTIAVGPIPSGLTIDHLCRNIVCVRPSHLEAVPGRINTLRGFGPSAVNARREACIHGHELTGWNLKRRRNGRRQCRTCHAIVNREYRERKAVAA